MSGLFVPANYPAFCRYAVLVNATAAAWRGEPRLLYDTTVIVIATLLFCDNENLLFFFFIFQGDKIENRRRPSEILKMRRSDAINV